MKSVESTMPRTFWEFVLYSVPLKFGDYVFTDLLRQSYADVISSKRILQYPDKDPTTLVRVRASTSETQRRILATGCHLGNYWFKAQLPRKRHNLRRCFNCQQITNHLSRNCPGDVRCLKCSGPHPFENCTSVMETCANCGGPHRANSTSCPHWLSCNQPRPQHEWVGHRRLENILERLESTMNDKIGVIVNQMDIIRTELELVKSRIASVSVPLVPESRSPPPIPDQPSGLDEDPQDDEDATPSPPPDPHLSPEPMDQHFPDIDLPTTSVLRSDFNDDVVNNVNDEIETENASPIYGDTRKVDSTRIETPSSPENELVKHNATEKMEHQVHADPNMEKILFRYWGGSLCKSIAVRSMVGVVSFVEPCEASIKTLKKLRTREIDCCPFHHLAAEIRDTIDKKLLSRRPCKKDALTSLECWRTCKNSDSYCTKWQNAFYEGMKQLKDGEFLMGNYWC